MKKRLKKIAIILIVVIIFVTTATLTLGKYVYNNAWNYYLSSKGFYFESDLLDINTKKNALLQWNGNEVYFEIKNSQNDKLISEYDISYKITCEVLGEEKNYIECKLNGTDEATFNGTLVTTSKCLNTVDDKDVSLLSKSECEISGYTWKEEVISKNNYFHLELIDPTKSIDEVSVKITAESVTPYHQILTGVFNLNRVDDVDLDLVQSYQSYSEYDEISLANTTTSDKCVSINFDKTKYSFDVSDNKSLVEYYVDENDNIVSIMVKIDKESSKSYKFYKVDNNKIYSINDFSIQEKEC